MGRRSMMNERGVDWNSAFHEGETIIRADAKYAYLPLILVRSAQEERASQHEHHLPEEWSSKTFGIRASPLSNRLS